MTADTTLYSVFKRADGRKTYLAFNAGKAPISVRFSDGKTLTWRRVRSDACDAARWLVADLLAGWMWRRWL